MENVNQESKDQVQTQDQDAKETEKKEQPSVTKQIEKMRRRIDKEVGQRKESESQNEKLKEQVKTLTEKLKAQDNPEEGKNKNPELDKAMNENEKLKAQLIRRDQMDTVAQQFNEAGVIVPKDVLSLVVPIGVDEKQVSTNMKALSSFYDSIVANVKKEFMSAPTPRITGSDDKPFDKDQVRKIKDPVKRVQMIKEHLNDY